MCFSKTVNYILKLVICLGSCAVARAVTPQCLATATSSETFSWVAPGNALAFGNVISDTDNIHGSDNRTFTIHTAGVYAIQGFVSASASSNNLFLGIKINDTYYPACLQLSAPAAHLSTGTIVKLNVGDTVKIMVDPDVSFTTYAGSDRPARISIVQIGSDTTPQCLATATSSETFSWAAPGNALAFGNVISDTDNIHGSDNRTFTIHTAGVYAIQGFVSASASSNNLFLGIKINDTYYPACLQLSAPAAHLSTGTIVKLNVGDTVKIMVDPDVSFTTYAGSDRPARISIVQIGSDTTPQCLATATSSETFSWAAPGNALAFGNVISDTDNIHGTDSRTFTIHTAGVYAIQGFVSASASSNDLFIGVKINSAYFPACLQLSAPAAHLSSGTIVNLNAGDTVEIMVDPDVSFTTYSGSDRPARISLVRISGMTDSATQITSLQQQIADLNTQIDQLTAELKSCNDTDAAIQAQVTSLNNQLTAAQATIAQLQSQVSTLAASNQDLQNQLSATNAQVAALTSQLTTTQSQNATLTAQLNAATAQNATLAAQNTQLANNLQAAQAANQTLRTQLTQANAQVAQLTSDLQASKAANQALQTQNAVLTAQNAQLTSANQTLTAQNNAMSTQIQALDQFFATMFNNPTFQLPGSTPQQQLQNLVNAISQLNHGQQQALYKNLGGK